MKVFAGMYLRKKEGGAKGKDGMDEEGEKERQEGRKEGRLEEENK